MDTMQENVEDLVAHVTDYMEAQKELIILNGKEQAATALSATVVWLFAGVLALLATTFLSVALAMWLGHLLGSGALGFSIIGSAYLVAAAVFYSFGKQAIQDRLSVIFITKFTSDDASFN